MSVEDVLNETVRYLDKPVWKATELWANDSSWMGTAQKVVSIFAICITAPLAIFGETLHFASHMYYQRSYLSYTSDVLPKTGQPQTFFSFNACGFPGICPTFFGGVTPVSYRMDDIAKLLKQEDTDIICLQEVAFDTATQLIDKLKDRYSFFYYRVGPNPYMMESCLFWASKCPLEKAPEFIPFNVPNMQRGIRRGFFVAELEGCRVITTHLDPKNGEVRAQEIEAIIEYIATLNTLDPKQTLLMGDLNIEAKDTRALNLLSENFPNFKKQDVLKPTEENATCLDNSTQYAQNSQLIPEWTVVDHILAYESKALEIFEKIVPTFALNKFSGALSDHYAVVMKLA